MTTTRFRPIVILPAFAAVFLRVASSDRLLQYVRPASRSYVEITGVVLAFIAVAGIAAPQTWLHSTTLRQPGWFVALPIATLVLSTPPSGGAMVRGHLAALPPRPRTSLALPGPDPVNVTVASVAQRAIWAPASMNHRVLRILGFVASRGTGNIVVARLSITCCAADAQRDDIVVRVPRAAAPPSTGRWVTVTGRFAGNVGGGRFEPVIDAIRVEAAATPADPYD